MDNFLHMQILRQLVGFFAQISKFIKPPIKIGYSYIYHVCYCFGVKVIKGASWLGWKYRGAENLAKPNIQDRLTELKKARVNKLELRLECLF